MAAVPLEEFEEHPAALCVPPVVAALSARETHRVPTELLGERAADGSVTQPEKVTA
ncbi:hypothetical protein WJ438_05690 [Streptomyces sp. GD-15H]|uniref:hypothetical protein n=1 Tax=Streptomyces sp. GD-15H TaxID=3129112 RepID=UPI0032473B94